MYFVAHLTTSQPSVYSGSSSGRVTKRSWGLSIQPPLAASPTVSDRQRAPSRTRPRLRPRDPHAQVQDAYGDGHPRSSSAPSPRKPTRLLSEHSVSRYGVAENSSRPKCE